MWRLGFFSLVGETGRGASTSDKSFENRAQKEWLVDNTWWETVENISDMTKTGI